jgi:hypothetical protein
MPTAGVTNFPVNSVTLVIGYETQRGIEEVVHLVDGKKCDIVSVQHSIERKTRAVKDDDGSIIKYEETGEEVLLLKVKYIRGT